MGHPQDREESKLKGEALGQTVDLDDLSRILGTLPEEFQKQEKVQHLRQMIDQARSIEGSSNP